MTAEWTDDEWSTQWIDDERAEWREKWAPKCPIGNPQRVGRCLAYREREPGRLQLRVLLLSSTEGICEAIVDEDEDSVKVRVILCYEEGNDADPEYIDCPVHVYLEKPLNGRDVIDVDNERALPLYVPSWEVPSTERTSGLDQTG
jgi:hypothetical protein